MRRRQTRLYNWASSLRLTICRLAVTYFDYVTFYLVVSGPSPMLWEPTAWTCWLRSLLSVDARTTPPGLLHRRRRLRQPSHNICEWISAGFKLVYFNSRGRWNGTAFCDGVCSEVGGNSRMMTNMFFLAFGMVGY